MLSLELKPVGLIGRGKKTAPVFRQDDKERMKEVLMALFKKAAQLIFTGRKTEAASAPPAQVRLLAKKALETKTSHQAGVGLTISTSQQQNSCAN
jgi:hypothetical protein